MDSTMTSGNRKDSILAPEVAASRDEDLHQVAQRLERVHLGGSLSPSGSC